MKICVIGTGYVGLVAGAAFADFGNNVTCVDINEEKVDMLNRGEIPIYEPGLDRIVERNAAKGRLLFSTDILGSVKDRQVVFLAVGTPQGDDGNANLAYLKDAALSVAQGINQLTIVVNKSTVPVGTAEVIQEIFNKNSKEEAIVISNPEFLKEGDAINDFMKPERVIIGTTSERARHIMGELYAPFVRSRNRIIFMDAKSAELTKYASNSFLATRISFMNEIARLCDVVGADVESVRKGMGSDSRIGPKFLYPGIGYGGSCFPKDISAILYLSHKLDTPLHVVESTHAVNDRQKVYLVEKLLSRTKDVKGLTVGILGLAFKPNTDDVREAPAHKIIEKLLSLGAVVRAYDPIAMDNFALEHPQKEGSLTYCKNLYETVTGCDATFLCTEWHELQRPDFAKIHDLMRGNLLFDGRNVWSQSEVAEAGFIMECVGRPTIEAK
ncbi:UDP-glucose/GDP-mannose dehydrogenase family protein [Myxococcota bacterium]|nr:UDP-glucose/GDP-mannose dehydrogenase family protein [Myxococcota bacterium]MBU1537368.1 UDP-glucose/GDP-mannose dehydrogenase family protein [Myxococcota bacterium]